MRKYVVFSIDNVTEMRTLKRFLKVVDTAKAMKKMEGDMKLCIGSYKGVMEQSFIMRQDDFEAFVVPNGFVQNQESFLILEYGHKDVVYASLLWNESKRHEPIGRMVEVSHKKALRQDAWTYRPDLNAYFVAEAY